MEGVSQTRLTHSIRTRYSIATALFLLFILAVFYVGGRVVLVHLMRDAERQVSDIGCDIRTLAYRNAERAKRTMEGSSPYVLAMLDSGSEPEEIFDTYSYIGLALALHCRADGSFVAGAARTGSGDFSLSQADVAPYSERIAKWIEMSAKKGDGFESVGIMQLRGEAFYVSLARGDADGDCAILGTPFDSRVFSAQVNEGFSGVEMKITDRKSDVSRREIGTERNDFGIAPMLSEAMNFYTNGFWDFEQRPFEAVFAVRDIAGNAISMIMISLPQALSTVARAALGRLTFFIATVGILLVLPIFWFQGRVLLNPLTKMTAAIRDLGDRHLDTDCPRIEWKGKDEFALLAASVNRMLETISARTVMLAQLETRQRALIDGLPDALVVFDRAGRLVSMYKQPVGTAPVPGLAARTVPSSDVYEGKDVKAFLAGLGEVFDGGDTKTLRFKAGGRDGSAARHFEMRLSRMDDHFALGIIRDVTPEVNEHNLRLAAEKRAMDESKRESLTLLAAGIAHDVNNVLSVILNTVEAAHASLPVDVATEDALRAVRSAVKRGSAMTKELMTFAGETRISLARMSPSEVISDVQTLAERTLGPNVSVSYVLADGLPDVDIDPNQFWKVLFNIVKNAGEAIGDRPGHLTVSTEAYAMTRDRADGFVSDHTLQPGSGVLFTVADDGPGVSPELLPRLFDPYVSSHSLGRGLGLATVRSIVGAHAGGIKVESRLGHGTSFMVYIPESHLPPGGGENIGAPPHGVLPREVLVVDNDEGILKTCAILLRSIGIEPHVARTRNEALGVLRRAVSKIGAVLLDANLGAIDTVRLLEAMRAAEPSLRVVVSSGSNEEEIARMFAGSSFDFFLAKPYTIAELKRALTL